MNTLFVVTSDIGFEPVVGTVASVLNQCVVSVVKKPNEMKDITLSGYMPGDYVVALGNKITFDSSIDTTRMFRIAFESGTGPVRYLISLMGDLQYISLHSPLLSTFFKTHKELIDLIDDRIRSIDNDGTQDFVTGLFNYMTDTTDNSPSGIDTKFRSIFASEVSFESIRKMGLTILSSQLSMVKDRVMKNSREGHFSDGRTYVITESTELYNMTHSEMGKKQKDITIVVSLKLREDGDRVHYSMRSSTSDVLKIIKDNTDGDGYPHSAGGTQPIDLHLQDFVM